MATNNTNGDLSGRTERHRIIEEAQRKCHEARALWNEAQSLTDGQAPRTYRLQFQQAIINYYYALRPLRDKTTVADYWQTAVLSSYWIKDRYKAGETTADEIDEKLPADEFIIEETGDILVPHYGLDTIRELETAIDVDRVQTTDMRGTTESIERRQKVLSGVVLADISSSLDDTAGKLGFEPDTKTPVNNDPTPV